MGGEVDGNGVVGGFGGCSVGRDVELDRESCGIHDDAEIAEVSRVVVFQGEVGVNGEGRPVGAAHLGEWGMSAASGYEIGGVFSIRQGPGEALIVVGVAGENGVRPDAGGLAGGIDVGEHERAAAMG